MSFGGLNPKVNESVSKEIAHHLSEAFNIPSDRYYIEFFSLKGSDIGYQGATF